MSITTDSFFRVFQPNVRQALRWLFENRQRRTTPEMAAESVDSETLNKLVGLGFIEYDADTSDYRFDDRVERFLEEMLGASAQRKQTGCLRSCRKSGDDCRL